MYSLGYSIDQLELAFSQLIEQAVKQEEKLLLNDIETYHLALNIIAIAVLLNKKQEQELLKEIIPNYQEDRILSYVLNPKNGLNPDTPLLFPTPYHHLSDAIENKANPSTCITIFLKEYYAGLKNCSWHDSHLNNEQRFFGYWSFGLAAIIKSLNIDDTFFAGHMFYPRDLTGQIFLPVWEDSERGKAAQKELSRLKNQSSLKEELNAKIDAKATELVDAVKELFKLKHQKNNEEAMPQSFVFQQIFKSLNKSLSGQEFEGKTKLTKNISVDKGILKEFQKYFNLDNDSEFSQIEGNLNTLFKSEAFGETIDQFLEDLQDNQKDQRKTVEENFQKIFKKVQSSISGVASESEAARKKKYHEAAQSSIAKALEARGIKPIFKKK